jgi:hypothetical protein
MRCSQTGSGRSGSLRPGRCSPRTRSSGHARFARSTETARSWLSPANRRNARREDPVPPARPRRHIRNRHLRVHGDVASSASAEPTRESTASDPQVNLGVSWGVSVPGPTAFGGRLRADGYSRVTRRDPTVPFNRPRHSGALSETRKQLCVVAPLSSAESRPCARGAFASVLRAARRMPRIALSRRHRRS